MDTNFIKRVCATLCVSSIRVLSKSFIETRKCVLRILSGRDNDGVLCAAVVVLGIRFSLDRTRSYLSRLGYLYL